MKKILSVLFFLLVALSLNAQIESGKAGSKKKRKTKVQSKEIATEKAQKPLPKEDYTLMTLSYSIGSSYRTLKPNGDFYGEPLGERADEKRLPVSGAYLGANTKFDQNIHLDFGIGFQQYGEQYTNSGSDTVISYQTKYSHFVLPIKVQYETGKKIIFFVGTGFQAQLLTAYQNKTSTTIEGVEKTVKVTDLKNKNPFALASTSSVGVQLPMGNKANLVVSADYIFQLSNTFNKQASYVHHADLLALKIGLGFKL